MFTSGFNLNTTCDNALAKDSKECDNYLSASRTDAPYSALEAFRQTRMSTNGKWYVCSDCSHDAYLDSPAEVKLALINLINKLNDIETANGKSVPDLFSPRLSAMPEI